MSNPTKLKGLQRSSQPQVTYPGPEIPFNPEEPPPATPIDPDEPDLPRYDDPAPPTYTDDPPIAPVNVERRYCPF
jgi:hypothetical protein